ncbi:MAG: hypothetical protein EOO77_17865 [Oxalobacteraceae bacterium]|nr:MAG: hypothetical protein EOO77_17865 [Oxalobacteraceae bacterium]
MDVLVGMVREVNPYRSPDNLQRRLLKVLEELGESAEAYLSTSSPHNYKNKTWLDYREESVDTLIVLIDVALTEITNYPPSPLIPAQISIATENRFDNATLLMQETFAVAGAVSRAAECLVGNNPMGFYGAVSRGIQHAANMCFALIPEDQNRAVIAQRVTDLFEAKIGKWAAAMDQYRATDDGVK